MTVGRSHRKAVAELIAPLRVAPGKKVVLGRDHDPRADGGLDKHAGRELLADGIELLAEYQERLAAQDTYGLLVVLQAIDAAGKDGSIRHVMTGVNPQGVSVSSFKAPSAEELDHDYLWRYAQRLPQRGQIGIFNRSHYEEVLVVRVHAELLARQKLPPKARGRDVWKRRYREINDWERYLVDNGIRVVKLFLNLSKEEQRRRFLARIDEPDKNWKFSAADVEERRFWDDYQRAFSEMLSQHEHRVGAVARDPRRPQVVRAARRLGRHRGRADGDRPRSSRRRATRTAPRSWRRRPCSRPSRRRAADGRRRAAGRSRRRRLARALGRRSLHAARGGPALGPRRGRGRAAPCRSRAQQARRGGARAGVARVPAPVPRPDAARPARRRDREHRSAAGVLHRARDHRPLQILWINFAIDVLLAVGLGFDAAAPGLMRRAPRDAAAAIVDRALGIRLGIASFVMAVLALGIVAWGDHRYDLVVATTMGLTTLSLMHIVAALESREPAGTIFKRYTIANRRFVQLIGASLALAFLVTELSPLQRIFDTVSLTSSQWGICLLGPLVFLAVAEAGKLADRRRRPT